MFKKFKDKLAEEMKQSPARLQASMQQLAQAVVSPALSATSIQELSTANDNFSLTEEGDETPKNSPLRHGFRSVDLTSANSNSVETSRRSSTSSVNTAGDAASLFPIYENPGNMYHIQSDIEQSASEVDENFSPQLERVSKDQLYSAYRKVQTKYQKYRGRYTDLANHYREMERVKGKLESVLVETQDKALRRIADLKEQCLLEQQAKAHLEEALRNDIEEKDHVIETLNTKVMLLQTNVHGAETSISGASLHPESRIDEANNVSEILIDVSTEKTDDNVSTNVLVENSQLKSKIEKLETLLNKYKETLRRGKEKIVELTEEKSRIEREFETTVNNNSERFKELEDDLNVARREITNLREDVTAMRKREEDSTISLAENKLTIHRELELKEEQIKELRKELKTIENSTKDAPELQERNLRIEELENQLKISENNREELERSVERFRMKLEEKKHDLRSSGSFDGEKSEKFETIREFSRGKSEALEVIQMQMQREIAEIEERIGSKLQDEETKNFQLTEKLERREEDIKSYEREINELRKESDDYREKCQVLRNELSIIKDKEYRDEIFNRNLNNDLQEGQEKVEETKNNAGIDGESSDVRWRRFEENSATEFGEKEENEWRNKCEELRGELSSLRMRYDELERKIEAGEALKVKETKNNAGIDGESSDVRRRRFEENSATEFGEKEENEWRNKCEELRDELSSLRTRYDELERKIEADEASVFIQRDETIAELNLKIDNYVAAVKTARERIEAQETELNRLRSENATTNSNDNELARLTEESESKSLEILGIQSEFKSCKRTVDDLREKLTEESKIIDKMTKEKRFIVSNLNEYRKTISALKNDYKNVKSEIIDCGESRKNEFLRVKRVFEEHFKRILDFETKNKTTKLTLLENELQKSLREKETLQHELKNRDEEISLIKDKFERFNDCDRRNSKLLAEIDNLNFLAFDFDKLKIKHEELRREFTNNLQESIKLKEESINWEKMSKENLSKYETLQIENLQLKKMNEEKCRGFEDDFKKVEKICEDRAKEIERLETKLREFHEINEEIEREHRKTAERVEEEFKTKCRDIILEKKVIIDNLEEEIQKLKEKHENEIKILENNDSFAKTNYLKLQKEFENQKDEYTKKLSFFEAECAKRDDGLEKLRLEMEKREKMLENLIEKSNNFDTDFNRISEEKLSLVRQLENREKLLEKEIEKSNKFEAELSRISEENIKLVESLKELNDATTKSEETNESLRKIVESKNVLLKKLEALKKQQEETTAKNATKLTNFEEKITLLEANNEKMVQEKAELAASNARLEKQIKNDEELKDSLLKKLEALKKQQEETTAKNATKLTNFEEKITLLEANNEKMVQEKAELAASNARLEEQIKNDEELKDSLLKKLEALKKQQEETTAKNATKLTNFEEKITLLEANNEKMVQEKARLEEQIKNDKESKDSSLRDEIKRLNNDIEESKKLCKDLEETINDSRKREEESRIEIARLTNEIEKHDSAKTTKDSFQESNLSMIDTLRSELQERESKLLNSETKTSQIEILNEELRNEIERLKRQSETNEAEQSMRLKQLVKEFQAQLHDKDDELQAALDKRFENQQNYESDLVQQYREQLKDFQVELTMKSEEIENLLLEKRETSVLRDREMEKTLETIERIKQEHADELRESERKWKATLKQKSEQLEAKHEEEVGELAREWRNERRNCVEKTDEMPQELESTSRVAMAAVQSNTGSLHTLQQTMLSQRRELAELRKLVKLRHDTLEDSTEIEYLRNILYEYMMGRETVVLARVIAAVVKFDQEQTTKILKKEEDKLTLLGSLGLS